MALCLQNKNKSHFVVKAEWDFSFVILISETFQMIIFLQPLNLLYRIEIAFPCRDVSVLSEIKFIIISYFIYCNGN